MAAALAICLAPCGCGRVDTPVGRELPASDAADEPAPTSVYFEAESGQLSGFTIESDPLASGGEYILPPSDVVSLETPGNASATYTFTLGVSQTYLVWGRIRSPGAFNNSFWITIDDGPAYEWRLSTGFIWYWGAVTNGTAYFQPISFGLAAGTHRLVVQNAEPDVGLDRLYVTVPGDVPPGNDTPCDPPNSIQLEDGGCERSCGSHGSGTTCGAACDGLPPLTAYDCAVCCFASDAGNEGGSSDAAAE